MSNKISINGLGVKNAKTIIGPDGAGIQCDITFNGVKVGFLADSVHGGAPSVDISIMRDEVTKAVYRYMSEMEGFLFGGEGEVDETLSYLLHNVVALHRVRKVAKKGGALLVRLNLYGDEYSYTQYQTLVEAERECQHERAQYKASLAAHELHTPFHSVVLNAESSFEIDIGSEDAGAKLMAKVDERKKQKLREMQERNEKWKAERAAVDAKLSENFTITELRSHRSGTSYLITDKRTGNKTTVPLCAYAEVTRVLAELGL